VDYKKSMGFASHVTKKDKDAPASEFARTKSIREQREYLPVFTVRDELLNVIRESNDVIVVGETGSGASMSSGPNLNIVILSVCSSIFYFMI